MATISANIRGINWLRESVGGGTAAALALITFTMPAYTASSDNGQMGGSGTKINGVATSDTLETILAGTRRDGKTVTLQATTSGLGVTVEPGRHSTTEYWCGTLAVSSGSITFNLINSGTTEIDAASGVTDKPITILVAVRLT